MRPFIPIRWIARIALAALPFLLAACNNGSGGAGY